MLWPGGPQAIPTPVPGDDTLIAPEWQWEQLAAMLEPFGDELRAHLSLPLASGHVRRDMLAWTALAHDWGKPAKRVAAEDGRSHFYDHDHWGALLAETRMQALRFSGDEIAYVARLTDVHMRPGHLANDFPASRRALYRYFRDAGSTGPDAALLSLADHLAAYASKPESERWQQRLETARMILQAFFRERRDQVDPPPLLDGRQVMAELGLQPGPLVGELLESLREAQAAGDVRTVDEAVRWLRDRVTGNARG